MTTTTTIDLLRHGETAGTRYYRGVTDDPLNRNGWRQMRNAVYDRDCWDIIISSPLRRCADFAIEFSREQQVPVHFADAFRELNFGDWEGKTAEQISCSDPDALMHFYTDPNAYPPPRGENMQNFHLRVVGGWHNLLDQYPGQRILLISHAGVIRMLFAFVLQIPLQQTFHIQVEHAGMTRFRCIHPDFYQLVFHQGQM